MADDVVSGCRRRCRDERRPRGVVTDLDALARQLVRATSTAERDPQLHVRRGRRATLRIVAPHRERSMFDADAGARHDEPDEGRVEHVVPASSSNEIDHDDGVVEVPSFGPSRRINPLDGTVRPANGSASRAVVGTADVEVGPTTSVPAGWEVPHAARPTAPTATIAANLVTLRRTPGSVATFPFS
jgi:hypothetical protein